MHIQKLEAHNTEILLQLKDKEDQLGDVRNMLERTIEVKLEYEEVIKALLAEDAVRDLVLEVCLKNRKRMEST